MAQTSKKTIFQMVNDYILTGFMTLATVAINFGLEIAIQKLTEYERHMTKTDEILSLIVKTVIAQFLNTAIIYYVISLIADNILLNDSTSLGDNGLVVNVVSLIAVSGAIQIALNLAQLGQIYTCLRNKCKYSGLQQVNLFQVELNKELQPTQFSFAMRYSYYILNVYIVSFFSYIVPYISLILIAIFIAQYWVDKINLFERFSCPTNFNYRLSVFTLKIFECSIFFFAAGNLIFAETINPNNYVSWSRLINIISLSITFLYCIAIFFLPKQWLQSLTDFGLNKKSYTQCVTEQIFNKAYKHQNPATTFAKQTDKKQSNEKKRDERQSNQKKSNEKQSNERKLNVQSSSIRFRNSKYVDAKDYQQMIASKDTQPSLKDQL